MCVSGISSQSISVQCDRLLQEQHVVTTRLPVGESGRTPPYTHTRSCCKNLKCVCVWSLTVTRVTSWVPLVVFFYLHGSQVAGGGGASSQPQLQIFSLNRSSPRLVKTVATRADVLCLEYVREGRGGTAAPEAQTGATTGSIICAGLQDGRSARSGSFSSRRCSSVLTQLPVFTASRCTAAWTRPFRTCWSC